MKKLLCIIALTLVMLTACEKEIQFEFYPEMREYYTESCGLQAVGADSVLRFAVKGFDFVERNPDSKEHPLYPKVIENIKTAASGTSFTFDTDDDDDITYEF